MESTKGIEIKLGTYIDVNERKYRRQDPYSCITFLGITFEFDDFCLLGVRFNKHLETIADDNYVGKIEEIRKLLNAWSKRFFKSHW